METLQAASQGRLLQQLQETNHCHHHFFRLHCWVIHRWHNCPLYLCYKWCFPSGYRFDRLCGILRFYLVLQKETDKQNDIRVPQDGIDGSPRKLVYYLGTGGLPHLWSNSKDHWQIICEIAVGHVNCGCRRTSSQYSHVLHSALRRVSFSRPDGWRLWLRIPNWKWTRNVWWSDVRRYLVPDQ